MITQVCAGVVFFFSIMCSLEAVSLRLQNESHYMLSATIIGADGSRLGDVIVKPQQMLTWTESSRDGFPPQGPSKSLIPMTVQWYCSEGEIFCISEHATSGSLIRTSQCVGNKACKEKKEGQK